MQNSLFIKILGVVRRNNTNCLQKIYKKMWLFLTYKISNILC